MESTAPRHRAGRCGRHFLERIQYLRSNKMDEKIKAQWNRFSNSKIDIQSISMLTKFCFAFALPRAANLETLAN